MSSTSAPSASPASSNRPRRRLPVAGAEAVLTDVRTGTAAGVVPGVAAARALVRQRVDWASVRADIVAAERAVILAGDEAGPVLAARAFDPARPTTVHDHGCAGAAIAVEGRQRYERFVRDERDGATAHLESTHDLTAGDVVWWGAPPDDLHRQRALDAVTIELVLLCGPVAEAATYMPEPSGASRLRQAIAEGFLVGDVTALRPCYHHDALFDLNVPQWRFQVRGREPALQLLHDEELAQPGRRVTFLRVTDTAGGLLLETETRHGHADDGAARAFRELHHLRLRDGLVAEHVLWCTGIIDADTSRRQLETAPMERM
jgi:hypothetical protein